MTDDWTTGPTDASPERDGPHSDESSPDDIDSLTGEAAETLPAEVPERTVDAAWFTGDPRVDDAVARLADLDDRDLDEHADVYDTIHSDLADVLDDAEDAGNADKPGDLDNAEDAGRASSQE